MNALSRELRNLAGKDDWWDIFYTTPGLAPLVPEWLAKIDPFDNVSADIRKEMGWR